MTIFNRFGDEAARGLGFKILGRDLIACLTDAVDEVFAGDAFFRCLFGSWFLGEVVDVFWATVCV
jgi:hypothetical protein